jgi:hypothetical protein
MRRSALIRFVAFLGVLAVLLGYVAYHRTPASQTSPAPSTSSSTTSSLQALANYFANYRQHRDDVMSKEIATLEALVKNPGVSQQARDQAEATLVRDTEELKQAMRIEGIVSAHGFPLVAAEVQPNSVVVMVGAQHLTADQVAQIADTATQVTGLPPEDVVIVPKSSA